MEFTPYIIAIKQPIIALSEVGHALYLQENLGMYFGALGLLAGNDVTYNGEVSLLPFLHAGCYAALQIDAVLDRIDTNDVNAQALISAAQIACAQLVKDFEAESVRLYATVV